jgi:hypothetical protein
MGPRLFELVLSCSSKARKSIGSSLVSPAPESGQWVQNRVTGLKSQDACEVYLMSARFLCLTKANFLLNC